MRTYTVKQLARLAGVSVRTLHLYDELGLLVPAQRTEARYRLYGEAELLRLQQILFYKELDVPLQEIQRILDDPDFDLVQALQQHRTALKARKQRLAALLRTLDRTIDHLTNNTIMEHTELYEGLPKEEAENLRRDAVEAHGKEAVERSEAHLMAQGKPGIERLKAEAADIMHRLIALRSDGPTSDVVQAQIARHYANIRAFWGTSDLADPQLEAYAGLGELYVADDRFLKNMNVAEPGFAQFLCTAMAHFVASRNG